MVCTVQHSNTVGTGTASNYSYLHAYLVAFKRYLHGYGSVLSEYEHTAKLMLTLTQQAKITLVITATIFRH